jgi:hypothetical protein
LLIFNIAMVAQGQLAESPPVLATRSLPKSDNLPSWIAQYSADQKTVQQRFRIPLDPIATDFQKQMLTNWKSQLGGYDFKSMAYDDQLDYLMLAQEIRHDQELLDQKLTRDEAAKKLIPYSELFLRYVSAKEHGTDLQAESAASILEEITNVATKATQELLDAEGLKKWKDVPPTDAIHASELIDSLLRYMQDSHRYHEGYDPKYTWWASKPFEAAKAAVQSHRKAVREKLAGISDKDTEKIVGQPIGAAALSQEIRNAWLPYTADELIAIGEYELQWCDDRFREAANDLKQGGDWKKALEHVKSLHVEPGDQPRLIRELAWEAIRFLEANDLLNIPMMAKQGWRVEMMTPEAQRVNPYFLGGDNIIVSFPTNTMTHSEKLMSLKSNNIHFCRATVHHELVPGHHLQYYVLARYRPYRQLFRSPFWMEGWALYWEMLLWDIGFAQSPEDRVGMLFWRRHRAARIIFSLNYQTGKWTADECVKYLIDRVGHEPSAAAAEVRRSIMGNYGPLYQAGYMLGGLQLRSLHKELVQSGKMTNRVFHDAVLQENYIPFELLRMKLLNLPLSIDQTPNWKFHTRN